MVPIITKSCRLVINLGGIEEKRGKRKPFIA